jgi:hypothetical protein
MYRSIPLSLLAGIVAMACASGSFAQSPQRDPGQDSVNAPSQPAQTANSPRSTGSTEATRNGLKDTAGAITGDAEGRAGTSLAKDKFNELDANSDGMIDRQEASASSALAAEFDRLDVNKDGRLSLSELSAAKNLAAIKVNKSNGKKKSSSSGY